jgi:cytochrome c553
LKNIITIVAPLLTLLAAGCANLERTRALDDAAVPATTTAQQVCSNCHGLTGSAESPNYPNLAGQSAAYIAAQLTDYKSHSRNNPTGSAYMWGLTRSLTDAQINGLADYYAKQQPAKQAAEGQSERMLAGKIIFENGLPSRNVPACAVCHGDQGQGNGMFPRISGQHVDYIVKQLTVFKETDQRPHGEMMKQVARQLTSDDMLNLADFIQGLPSMTSHKDSALVTGKPQ